MKTEKVEFTWETKEEIVTEWEGNGWFLIEEQLHKDGKWLVFADELPVQEVSIGSKVGALEGRASSLETLVSNLGARVEVLENE